MGGGALEIGIGEEENEGGGESERHREKVQKLLFGKYKLMVYRTQHCFLSAVVTTKDFK